LNNFAISGSCSVTCISTLPSPVKPNVNRSLYILSSSSSVVTHFGCGISDPALFAWLAPAYSDCGVTRHWTPAVKNPSRHHHCCWPLLLP
jgi:hypothetical protein